MRKYDKIYVDAEGNNKWRPSFEDLYEEIQGPLICMTIEELEKMLYFFFKEGEAHGKESERKDAFAKIQSPDFKKTLYTYLTSKGINTK